MATPSIYEWGGGREAFARWLNRFYDLVEREAPDIAAMFGGRVSQEHREHVTDWWVEVMGGPPRYTQTRGGYEHMLGRHRDLAITPEQRLRFVSGPRTRPAVGLGCRAALRADVVNVSGHRAGTTDRSGMEKRRSRSVTSVARMNAHLGQQ